MRDSKIEFKVQQHGIEPFWQKLPFFFAFPFRTGPLIMMAFLLAGGAIAGLVFGAFGVIFKGTLIYFGLRYGFNILDLFAKGRFEGESVDHVLWGPETRPGKFGLVIALFIAIGATIGNAAISSRLAKDPSAQQVLIDRYEREHKEAMAERTRAMDAFNKRYGLETGPGATPPGAPDAEEGAGEDDADAAAGTSPGTPGAEARTRIDPFEAKYGLSRQTLIETHRPELGDGTWSKLLPAWFWPLMIALSFMLPAAALVIALDDAFFKSLNPTFVPHFIRIMGSAYFVLWAFFLAIAGVRQAVLQIGANWPGFIRFPVELGLSTYLAWVLCALLGYTLYQFHQELHLDVEVDFDTHRQAGGAEGIAKAGSAAAAVHLAEPRTPLERKVQELLKAGLVKEAIAEVKDEMRYAKLDPELNDRLHDLYDRLGEPAQTLNHGQQWLRALVQGERPKDALAALRELRGLDPGFEIADGDAVYPIADAALNQGDRALAASLVNGFDHRFPEHRDIPAMTFLAARLLSEHWRRHGDAADRLRAWLAYYPDHALVALVQQYLAALDRMPGSKA